MTTRANSAVNEYERALVLRGILIKAGGVALFVALTAAAARIRLFLPFSPVPMTMQPMAVLLAGAVLGPWLGALSQLIYVGIGIAGLPVFAGLPGSGPAVLVGPTGGYLCSYPFVALIVGKLTTVFRGFIGIATGMLVGLGLIYTFGVLHLTLVFSRGVQEALAVGFYPFAVADLIKVVIAALAALGFRSITRGRNKKSNR
jgi:biotin transport system substrate-specific component